ncbi:MAG: class I SAM-dependent methyltransferase [Spirochaetales bacterium]|nr:class I SAM-dependent methyltransferase [Spirochaetales bacterium]
MHTRLSWWTQESIEWFERASKMSDYHIRLADEIEKLLPPCKTVLEFGCGLGYESEILSKRGYDVTAFDIDQNVINRAKARTGLDIFHACDANQSDASADALLCINYGHIGKIDHLEALLSHAKVRLVYVISRHNAHGTDTRPDRTEEIKKLLEENGYRFSMKEISLAFDQPLRSMDEAESFIEWTYLGKHSQRYMSFIEKTEDGMYPFVFRNRKENVLFSIETKERKR